MRKILLTVLSASLIGAVLAQKTDSIKVKDAQIVKPQKPKPINSTHKNPIIKFEKMTHDFGTIKEEKGPDTCVFKFKNVGKSDLLILSVRPSCGCTTSDYTKDPVKPGATGFIKAIYNPSSRPGAFTKSIAVVTNDSVNQNLSLFIKGNVLERPKLKEDLYPVQQGALRFLTNHLSFNMTSIEAKVDTLKVYNSSKRRMELKYDNLPTYITILSPMVLKLDPGAEAKILLKYDAAKRQEIGFVYDRFVITTNDTAKGEKVVYISANIGEDFSLLTPEQLANAPIVAIDTESYDFGKVKVGAMVDYYFVVRNTGKSKLIIRKVKASCGCTATQPEKTEVEPGDSTRIKASFNSTGRVGSQHKTITVITNDPKRSTITLVLKGEVLQDDQAEPKGDPSKGEGNGNIIKTN